MRKTHRLIDDCYEVIVIHVKTISEYHYNNENALYIKNTFCANVLKLYIKPLYWSTINSRLITIHRGFPSTLQKPELNKYWVKLSSYWLSSVYGEIADWLVEREISIFQSITYWWMWMEKVINDQMRSPIKSDNWISCGSCFRWKSGCDLNLDKS